VQIIHSNGEFAPQDVVKTIEFLRGLEKNSQIHDFSYFHRYFYYRELLQIQIPFDHDLKVIRNNKLGFKGIQEFSIGMKLCGIYLYNKDLKLWKLRNYIIFFMENQKLRLLKE